VSIVPSNDTLFTLSGIGNLKYAKAKNRHGDTVVQYDLLHEGFPRA
jgi:hypothetical protein